MPLTRLLSALLLCYAFAGQPPVTPEPPPGVLPEPIRVVCPEVIPASRMADVRIETEGKGVKVLVFQSKPGLDLEVTRDALRPGSEPNLFTFAYDPGIYRIVAYAVVGDVVETDDAEIRVGPAVVVTPPVVDPVVVPVEAGRRLVFLFWETNEPNWTNEQKAVMAKFVGEVRQAGGEVETYLTQKKHNLQLLDDDETAPQVQPWLQAWRTKLAGKPGIVIVDPARISGTDAGVIDISELPWPPTGKGLIELIKKWGG